MLALGGREPHAIVCVGVEAGGRVRASEFSGERIQFLSSFGLWQQIVFESTS